MHCLIGINIKIVERAVLIQFGKLLLKLSAAAVLRFSLISSQIGFFERKIYCVYEENDPMAMWNVKKIQLIF